MLDIYVEFTSFSWQGTKGNKPRSEVRETVEEHERVSGEDLGGEIHRVSTGRGSLGKRKAERSPTLSVWLGSSCLSGAVCQADLDFKLFSLSGVNFTCHVIILILISRHHPPLTPHSIFFFGTDHFSLHVSPRDFPAIIVGDSDWEGRLGRGFITS